MFALCVVKITMNCIRSYSYVHQAGQNPLKYITIGKVLENSANNFGENDAVISVHQKNSFTYKEALEKCDRLAAGFLNIGLQKGDRIGVWCPNLSEWFIIKFALARAGLILVALNPNYEIPELEYSINKVGIKCLVCPEKVKNRHFYEMLNTLVPNLQNSEVGKISSNKTPSLKSVITISDETLRGTYNYQEIAQCNQESLIKRVKTSQDTISPDEPFSILFSSGTTGKPKAAIVSHFSYVNNYMDTGRRFELNKKHYKICMMVPFFHAFGLSITTGPSVFYGSTLVLPSPTYSPSENLTAIKEERCTMIHGTPTMHLDLITEQRKRNEDISPEIAVSGGSPISSHQFKTMQQVLKLQSVKSIYGLTETTSVVFASSPGDDEEKSTQTVGRLSEHMEAKVTDSNGNLVPFGIPGELCVRGYANMIGYWDDKAKTEEMIGTDGWLKTGDQFVLTEDGYGKVVGRLKDMIIRGGENIFPKEAEDVLITHPDIIEVHVIGVPHERLGEEVCACVKLTENSKLTLQELVSFCKGKMANYKIPSHLKIMNEFPKTTSGKIQKYLLVDRFIKERN